MLSNTEMKKISAAGATLYTEGIPKLFLFFGVAGAIFSSIIQIVSEGFVFPVGILLLLVIPAYYVYRKLFFKNFVEEAWANKDIIKMKKKGEYIELPLAAIQSYTYSQYSNPPYFSFYVSSPGIPGRSYFFLTPRNRGFFLKDERIQWLIERINEAKYGVSG